MFKYLWSFIWPEKISNNGELNLNQAYALLQAVDESEPTENKEQESEFTYETKVGTITEEKNGSFRIDNLHTFPAGDKVYLIGQQVSYMVIRDKSEVRITNIKIIGDDTWVENSDHQATWCVRTLIGEVSKRKGRLFYVQPVNICVDLNETASEFIPIVGDWVELEIKCELNENVSNLFGEILSINKVRPLRTKVIEGKIHSFNNTSGRIGSDTYFDLSVLSDGYFPRNGDIVCAEVMESTQKNTNWRALKVVLHNKTKDNLSKVFDSELPKLISFKENIEGVNITDDIHLYFNRLGEIKNFKIIIENNNNDMFLTSVEFETQLRQIRLKSNVINKLLIKKNESLDMEFQVIVKSAGESSETVIFSLDNFKVGRIVHLHLKPQSNNFYQGKHFDKYQKRYNSGKFNFFDAHDTSFEVIRGEKLCSSPKFIGGKMGFYNVPKKLQDVILDYDGIKERETEKHFDILQVCRCLNLNLSYDTYQDQFHSLLYLEEITLALSMRKYNQDRACFIRNGEYLMLEIENLSESRPSIIVGDSVMAVHPQNSTLVFEGCVQKLSSKHLCLKFNGTFHESYNGEDYSIQIKHTRSLFRKLHHGITTAFKNLGPAILFPTKVTVRKPQVNFTYDKYVDNITSADNKITKMSPKDVMENIRRFSIENRSLESNTPALKLSWFNKSLNYFQKEAVRHVLLGEARPLPYIIFGPPGTGKTVTIIETILQILRLIPHSRILVATPSNSSADLVATRLIDSGCLNPGDLVRLVSYRAVAENLVPTHLVPYSTIGSVCKEGTFKIIPYEENGIKIGSSKSAIGRHRITVGTCGALGNLHGMGFVTGHFTHIIVDEAGQCTEPEIMIPLSFLDSKDGQAILAGDPKQLGPMVLSNEADTYGFSESYICRLINRFPYIRDKHGFPKTKGYDPRLITLLVYNYRSLPEILYHSNKWFYNLELKAILSDKEGKEIEFLNSFREILPSQTLDEKVPCLVFHGLNSVDCRSEDSPSWFNPDEASQIFFYINELYRLGAKSTDIGIISPYVKQVKQIREILRNADFDVPKVGTVEDFQGQEFKVILMSTVRASSDLLSVDEKYCLGFVSNPRRLNVLLTRAQCLIIIVGNPNLLMHDKYWNELIMYCIKNNSYVGIKF